MRKQLFLASALVLFGALLASACDEGSGSSGNGGGSNYQGPCTAYADCAACVDAVDYACEWCAGACVGAPSYDYDSMVVPGASCEWGWATYTSDCTDYGGIRIAPTALDIDCRAVANREEPRCMDAGQSTPGSIGAGPAFPADGGVLYGGFVDGERVVVGANTSSPALRGSVWSVDLATGDRALVSGVIFDPIQGEISRGSGPDLGAQVLDIEPVSSSAWVAWTFENYNTRVLRIDAATGNRTLIYEDGDTAPCVRNAEYAYDFAGFNSSGLASIVVAADGSVYVPLGESVPNSSGDVGIAKLSPSGTCTIVTLGSTEQGRRIGNGPAAESRYRGLAMDGNTLYAVSASGQLHAVDIGSGDRTLISEEGILGEGPGLNLELLALADGQIWTSGDSGYENGIRVDVDPATGTRTTRDSLSGPLSNGSAPVLMLPHSAAGVAIGALQFSLVLYEASSGNNVLLSR